MGLACAALHRNETEWGASPYHKSPIPRQVEAQLLFSKIKLWADKAAEVRGVIEARKREQLQLQLQQRESNANSEGG